MFLARVLSLNTNDVSLLCERNEGLRSLIPLFWGQSDFNETLPGKKLRTELENQGIDFRTWQPALPILIGSYTVEFKPDAIQVGCKTIPHATVRAIAERLENPVVATERKAIINVHGDETLSRIVQELAQSHGWFHNCSSCCKKGTSILDPVWCSLSFGEFKDAPRQYSAYSVPRPNSIDARTQFGSVLDFFRQPAAPEIKVEGETVKFNADSIEVFGETVSKETIGQIVKRMEAV